MKKFYTLIVMAAFTAAFTACSTDEKAVIPAPETGNVQFVTRAPESAATPGPVGSQNEFRILAFKKTGSDFVYMKEIELNANNINGSKLTKIEQLPAGEYKFLQSYGLVTPGNYSWPVFTNATLSDALYISHSGESFPAAFMLNTPLDKVPSYTVSLDGPKQTINARLRRAVSRVDVLFIRADKDPATNAYTEKKGDDVFGPEKLAKATLLYTGANSRLGLSGEKVAGVFDTSHTLTTPADAITMGTGDATTVGTDGYDFENVLPADIVSGSAHLKGTYLIPNPDNAATTGFTLQLTSGANSKRTITTEGKIPVERNKATLIRVYVLGDNVFTTGVEFAVEVDTVWDGSNTIDVEIE